jgi:hypothetical protein
LLFLDLSRLFGDDIFADLLGVLELLEEFVNVLLDLVKKLQDRGIVHLGISTVRHTDTVQVFNQLFNTLVLLRLNLFVLLIHDRALHELALLLYARLAVINFLQALGEHSDLPLHLAFQLSELVLLSLELLFCILTLLNEEEIFLFEVCEDVQELIRVLKKEFILIVRVLDNFAKVFRDLNIVVVPTRGCGEILMLLPIALI